MGKLAEGGGTMKPDKLQEILFESELFCKVIAEFHRFDECGGFRVRRLRRG